MSPEIEEPAADLPITERHDFPYILRPIENMLQIQMAVFIPGKGWLHTRRGIVTHGIIPPWSNEEAAVLEVKNGLRAMLHRAAED